MKKILVAPDLYQLTLDRTGNEPQNKVTEEAHVLPNAHERLIVPIYGAFFDDSVVVKDLFTNLPLTKDQFLCVEMIKRATQATGKPVSKFISIQDPAVSNSVAITYQALGGERAYDHNKLNQLIVTELARTLTLDWKDIRDKPNQFPPGHHLHDSKDLYGLEYMVDVLKGIESAILTDKSPMTDALRQFTLTKSKANDQRYAVLFAQLMRGKLVELEAAADRDPGDSNVSGAGSMLLHYCNGTTLMGTYWDGNISTYDQVIQLNSPTCNGVPPTPKTPQMRLTALRGFIWPDKQPHTVDVDILPLPTPNIAALKQPVGSSVSAQAIFNDLERNKTYTANFATRVFGFTNYVPAGSMGFISDDNGTGVVDMYWPNGFSPTNDYSTIQDNRLIVALGPVSGYDPFTAAGGVGNAISIFTDGTVGEVPPVVVPKTTWSHPSDPDGIPSVAVITAAQAVQAGSSLATSPQPNYLLMKAPAAGEIPAFSYTAPVSGRYCFITAVLRYGPITNPMHAESYLNTTFLRSDDLLGAPYFNWVDMQAGDVFELEMIPQDNNSGIASAAMIDLRIITPSNQSLSASQDFITYNGAQRAPWAYFYRGSPSPNGTRNPDGAPLLT